MSTRCVTLLSRTVSIVANAASETVRLFPMSKTKLAKVRKLREAALMDFFYRGQMDGQN